MNAHAEEKDLIATTAQLDYAPRPAFVRGRRAVRMVWIAAILVMLAIAARLTPLALDRWRLLQLQNRCLSYTPPAGTVIAPGVNSIPPEWAALYPEVSGSRLWSDGTLFLHGMRRPDGQRRLVAVDFFRDTYHSSGAIARVVQLGSLRARAYELPDATTVRLGRDSNYAKLFPGAPDPQDETHFTFAYDNGRHVVDGWLRDDDTVLMESRPVDGEPITPAPPPSPGRSR